MDEAVQSKLALVAHDQTCSSYRFSGTTRTLLPDEAFALVSGPTPDPTDLVPDDVWSGITHLPDDMAIRTSDHHGSQLATLYSRWGVGVRKSQANRSRRVGQRRQDGRFLK